MVACERCWDLAFIRARTFGGHQAEHYRDLLRENEWDHSRSPTMALGHMDAREEAAATPKEENP